MQNYNRLRGYTSQSGVQDYHVPLPINQSRALTTTQIGKITRTNTEDAQRHDLWVVLSTGERLRAQPLSPFATTNHGIVRRTQIIPETPGEDANAPIDRFKQQGEQDQYVLIGFAGGDIQNPVILGSYLPQVNQMNNDKVGYIDRHFTDDVTLIDDEGNHAQYGPDGTGIVRGDENKDMPYHHDMSDGNDGHKNYDVKDKPWKLEKKRDNALTMSQTSGNTRVKMWPDGRVSIQQGNGSVMEIHANGDISHTTEGVHCTNAPTITLNSPTVHINGDLHVTGKMIASVAIAPAGSIPGPLGGGSGVTPTNGPVVNHDVGKPDNHFG